MGNMKTPPSCVSQLLVLLRPWLGSDLCQMNENVPKSRYHNGKRSDCDWIRHVNALLFA
jgi:hypothetical protein